MNDEARLIFSAYRPNGQDASDPTFTAALEAAKNDPKLAAWLTEQQQFDRAVAERLREVVVPADLKAKILAGAAVSRQRARWSAPRLAALAALLAVFFGLGALWMSEDRLADWQKNGLAVLSEVVAGKATFYFPQPDTGQLAAWLRDHGVPQPTALGGKAPLGCKMIAWDGHKMSLVCFNLGGGETVHLFTTDRTGLAGVPPDGPPKIVHEGAWTVAMWNEDGKTLMLASQQGEAPLRRVLQLTARDGSRTAFSLAILP